MRDASTKPSAATVLPAPVACSNQKRLAALGSSGASASCPRRRPRPASGRPSPAAPRRLVLVVVVLLAGDADGRERRARLVGRGAPLPFAVAVALRLGEQRGQRARQRVDLVGGEHRAVDERRLLLGEQALEAEQQRPLRGATATDGTLRAGVELGQRGVQRDAARRAGRERGRGVLAFGQRRAHG